MNTPSHHRVHHGTNPQYLDANYAGIFIVWDKLFGSFVPERSDIKIEYGLVKNIETHNPIRIAFAEMLGAIKDVIGPNRSLVSRLKYLFAPPGYSHDGSRQSSEDIKLDYVRANPEQSGQPGLPSLDHEIGPAVSN